jgi:nucleosome assembly protein 1-like 1
LFTPSSETLKSHAFQIIPRAVDYFSGKALRYELEDEDYSDDEDEDDDDDDASDEEDDDDEDEAPKK